MAYPSYVEMAIPIETDIEEDEGVWDDEDEEEEEEDEAGESVQQYKVIRVEFDCVESRETTYESDVPEYALEGGAYTSDTVLKKPISVKITAMITNMPVTWRKLNAAEGVEMVAHGESNRVELVREQLEEMYYAGELMTVVTPRRTYENMAMESITMPENDYENAMEVEMSFKRIEITRAKTGEAYEYSGTSALQSGAVPYEVVGEDLEEGEYIEPTWWEQWWNNYVGHIINNVY